MNNIFARRIWPPPRWPLIHEAKRVYQNGGEEALQAWADSLSPLEKSEFVRQAQEILAAAVEVSLESILKDIDEGRLNLV